MKHCVLIFLCLGAVAFSADPPATPKPAPAVPAVLGWNNGETVAGELVGATAGEVTWKSALFEDPLVVGWYALRRIDDQSQPFVEPADPFSFTLRDGSRIYGSLVAITGKTISIHSTRHGDVRLKCSDVLSMRRIRGSNLIYSGPHGEVGWEKTVNRQGNASDENSSNMPSTAPTVTARPGGALLMPYWNRSALFKTDLPELVDAEFHVRSSARPDFQFSLESDPKQRLVVETWDDTLVVSAAGQFKTIRKIADDERDVAMRLCWDRKAKKCSLFTPAGEPLAEWDVPENSGKSAAGLVLHNKGRDLSLEFLRIRKWDGKPPAKVDITQPYVELDDGRMISGTVGDSAGDSISVQPAGAETAQQFSLNEVDAVIFSSDLPKSGEQEAAFFYGDGTMLSGSIASISDGWATLKTSFIEEPFMAQMGGLRKLLIKAPAPEGTAPESPLEKLDRIVIQQITLHGRLVSGGEDWPRWIPVGGSKPSIPLRGSASEIVRALPETGDLPTSPALFYMASGDVLPGALRSLDQSGAEIESSVVEVTKLAANDINAIQFGAAARGNLRGFDDAGWNVLKGDEKAVRKTKDSLDMDANTSIGHPTLMQSGEIKFLFKTAGYSVIRLRMFCAGTDPANSTNLIIMSQGNSICSGLESSDGQFDNQTQIPVWQGKPAAIKLLVSDKEVQLCINDVPSQKFQIPSSKRQGIGLIIEPASMWGNAVNPASLSEFSASSQPGSVPLPDIGKESKTQALTVPRFRREDLPRHALVAANGDVLRGEIEAATASHFGFRSGLENLSVPRDRVKAVIWLKKPEERLTNSGTESGGYDGTLPVETLRQYANIALEDLRLLDAAVDQCAIEHKLTSGAKVKFADLLPYLKQGSRVAQNRDPLGNSYGDEFIVDKIPTLSAASWDVFARATNVEFWKPFHRVNTPDTPPLESYVKKAYWLKTDFPAKPSPKEILTGKGIPFPRGSAANWDSNSRLLSVTNTQESHERIAALLNADFGGSFGSPTHWLLLTSGARLALIVDKFDQDSISGHHPMYDGHCTVPMSNVYAIRTTAPAPTATAALLQDWRLVRAPEPVLPASGGESSPLLGKEAASFKLSLLGGGSFDLKEEKGKVIVLDFWASWCGPCVKSLPGLIEAMSGFPADKVKLVGINQSEPADQVKRFLETRGWKLTVAMDEGQAVARQYSVDGIPHTVIVGPDGKVAWVKSGYTPDGEQEAANTVKRLLTPPSPSVEGK